MLLEAVLGPLWVWLVLSEQPPNATLLGGAMILATLAWHSFGARRR
jgi:drug/metabolite transporter (DMT)-like permease